METRRTKVYLASPFWDEDPQVRRRNVEYQIINASILRDAGYLPFWPLHSYYEENLYPRNEAYWLASSLEWIQVMDCLLRQGGPSHGGDAEVEHADTLEIPVYFVLMDLLQHEPVLRPTIWILNEGSVSQTAEGGDTDARSTIDTGVDANRDQTS